MNKKIPSIIAILILLTGVGVGVFLLQSQQVFRLGASPTAQPKNVTITNITDSSFSVSWTTDEPTIGFIKWGENSPENTTDTQTNKSLTHHITVRGLNPQTNYQFSIYVDGSEYKNADNYWLIKTGSKLEPPTKSRIASGKVVDNTGTPVAGAILYAQVENSIQLSTTTSSDGQWFISLADARTQDKNAYIDITDQTLLEIFVEAGPAGNSAAKVFVGNANPTPEIVLGEVYDFTKTDSLNDNSAPEANLDLPKQEETASRFNAANEDNSQTQKDSDNEISITSIENNEIIYTQNPEFFGEGPANETITITIESDPITEDLLVDIYGNWSWEPPADLEEGEHTLTITWRDATGILHSVTRNFTVQAAESEPSFESTPSDSLNPSPTPTSTSTPSPSPSPSASSNPSPSPSPTSTSRASQPATDSEMPEAGVWENTVALATAGFLLLGIGLYLSLKS